ncbi:MAG: pantoate--beta-alanine ligase [Phenylobacterium sp.]|jgi:pantoate--beta-alanine ligase
MMQTTMQTVREIPELRAQLKQWRMAGERIAFVPTMGNLHQGHLSLFEEAKKRADKVVVSIFVNPMQFDNPDDLNAYPKTIEQDSIKLQEMQTDLLFLPSRETIYPKNLNNQTIVEVPDLSDQFCGDSRPGHFRGVTTVVNKLFNLVEPDVAIFGQKDYQQLFIIRHMVTDLCMNVEIIGAPTKREASGLAMSSRNGYLDSSQLIQATVIYQALEEAKATLQQGNTDFAAVGKAATKRITDAGLGEDFFHIQNADTLADAQAGDKHLVILVAAYLGKARLIDNMFFAV